MNNHPSKNMRLLAPALILCLITTACGLDVKSPLAHIKPGPTRTVDIQVPMPEGSSTGTQLNLEFIAGDLNLAPGAKGFLASGTATFNAVEFEPNVQAGESSYTLRAGELEIKGIPVCPEDVKNEWNVKLANTPMSLNINTGAYNGSLELGGLSLEKLSISEVGADVTVSFSAPNRVEMSTFAYSTGGSTVQLKGLANANFAQMTFDSGAGDYTLSFDGDLQRDASVTVESGAATVNILVPAGVNSRLTFEGGLTTINTSGAWKQNETIYTLSGSGPTITILVKMGMGTLNLKSGS